MKKDVKNLALMVFLIVISLPAAFAANYGSGTYGTGTYGIGETPATTTTTTTAPATEGGSYSGAPPSPTAFSSTTSVDVGAGEIVALSTAQGASFLVKNVEHFVDVKEIGEDFVRLWIYSEPIEVVLKVGKRASVDVDNDTLTDVSVELRSINNGFAFLYFKELKGVEEVKLPKGEKVIEEKITGEQVIELPEVKLEVKKTWMSLFEGFENFVKNNINYLINNVKAKKSWLIPSLAGTILLLSFFIVSLRFYLKKRKSYKI